RCRRQEEGYTARFEYRIDVNHCVGAQLGAGPGSLGSAPDGARSAQCRRTELHPGPGGASSAPTRGRTFLLMKPMMSCIGVPGRNTPLTPISFNFGMSTSGMIPKLKEIGVK